MKTDLAFNGGFLLDIEDEDELDDLVEQIEDEVNAALSRVATKYGLGFSEVQLSIE